MFFIINYVYIIDFIIFIKISKVFYYLFIINFLYCFGVVPPNLSPEPDARIATANLFFFFIH